ncbi:MAG: glycosyltransferase family 2 protein [Methylophaga sp.]|nr:glycosyltransferase family 2 protein [Methylophaga sp.]
MWFQLLFLFFTILLSIPLLVIGLELLITLLSNKPALLSPKGNEAQPTMKILMPAHNEADIIVKTLSVLIKQGIKVSDIIVVADNCTDSTAEISENLGTTVLERFNDELRGKGFALDHGLQYIKAETPPPDVVVILDADCEIDSSSLKTLVNGCYKQQRPVQALYLMRKSEEDSLARRVAGFAWLVKNKVRPIAVSILTLPITLTGTGMAFPWKVIADVNVAHGNIVEDMQLGIDCTLAGFPPILCEHATVYSDFPEQGSDAEKTQRTRWEHGHLITIIQQAPKLIKQAIIRKDWRLLGLALDIGVPPLSLLVLLSVIGLLFLAIYSCIVSSYAAFLVLLTSFSFFAIMLIMAWWKFGREYLTLKELFKIPVYIISKIAIYILFLFKRQKSWIRTSRKAK